MIVSINDNASICFIWDGRRSYLSLKFSKWPEIAVCSRKKLPLIKISSRESRRLTFEDAQYFLFCGASATLSICKSEFIRLQSLWTADFKTNSPQGLKLSRNKFWIEQQAKNIRSLSRKVHLN